MSQDPYDQLLLQIRGAVAEYERTLITERMRRWRPAKLHAGQPPPWVPFGYRTDPERPCDPAGLRVEEHEAAIVRQVFAGTRSREQANVLQAQSSLMRPCDLPSGR